MPLYQAKKIIFELNCMSVLTVAMKWVGTNDLWLFQSIQHWQTVKSQQLTQVRAKLTSDVSTFDEWIEVLSMNINGKGLAETSQNIFSVNETGFITDPASDKVRFLPQSLFPKASTSTVHSARVGLSQPDHQIMDGEETFSTLFSEEPVSLPRSVIWSCQEFYFLMPTPHICPLMNEWISTSWTPFSPLQPSPASGQDSDRWG